MTLLSRNVHLGTVGHTHKSFLRGRGQRVAASLRPAGDIVSSRPIQVLQVTLWLKFLFLAHIFGVQSTRVCGVTMGDQRRGDCSGLSAGLYVTM